MKRQLNGPLAGICDIDIETIRLQDRRKRIRDWVFIINDKDFAVGNHNHSQVKGKALPTT